MTRAAVVALLARRGPLSRAEIANLLALSPATVTQVTRTLLGQGLIAELGSRPSQGGRPAVLIGLNARSGHALGVHIAHDHVSGALVQPDAQIVDRFHYPFDPSAPDAIEQFTAMVGRQLERATRRGEAVLGIGVTVPGVVDPVTGTLTMSVRLGWTGTPLASVLRDSLGLPVLVDNDISAVTATERLYGQGAECDDFLLVAIGQGVGMGLVLDGAPYRGAFGSAGEFGHTPYDPDGPQCACGNRGCLETVVSTESLLRDARALNIVPPGADLSVLGAAADRGDTEAVALLTRAATVLGRALAGAVNLLGPETVFVMGESVEIWRHLEQPFRATLDTCLLPSSRSTRIEIQDWDDSRVAFGAAGIVLAAPLAMPRKSKRKQAKPSTNHGREQTARGDTTTTNDRRTRVSEEPVNRRRHGRTKTT